MINMMSNNLSFGAKVPKISGKSVKKWLPKAEYEAREIARKEEQIKIIEDHTDSLYKYCTTDSGELSKEASRQVAINNNEILSLRAKIEEIKDMSTIK